MISAICQALATGATDAASAIVQRDYPFVAAPVTKRRPNHVDYTKLFVRDGFIDRYTGDRLIFPPVLRVLSSVLPVCFPYHPNWKTDKTHPAYWELSATLDHLVPVTRGGVDEESNWVTTSMAHNSAKLNWTVEELGWKLYPPGSFNEWDGMLRWFLEFTSKHPQWCVDTATARWRHAARIVASDL